jgi:ABC-type molybdate transport system ATPase subunit
MDRIASKGWGFPATIGERCRVRILARGVNLAREPFGPSSILNAEPARIVSAPDDGTNAKAQPRE